MWGPTITVAVAIQRNSRSVMGPIKGPLLNRNDSRLTSLRQLAYVFASIPKAPHTATGLIREFMIRLLLWLCLSTSLLATGNITQNITHRITTANSEIQFEVKQFTKIDVKGEFKDFVGDITIKDGRIDQISGTIQVNSLTTRHKKRDQHLLSDDFLDVESYPEIMFKGRQITSPNRLTGELSLRGVTQNITLPVEMNEENGFAQIKGQVTLNRFDYKIIKYRRMIAPSINIRFQLLGVKAEEE